MGIVPFQPVCPLGEVYFLGKHRLDLRVNNSQIMQLNSVITHLIVVLLMELGGGFRM